MQVVLFINGMESVMKRKSLDCLSSYLPVDLITSYTRLELKLSYSYVALKDFP